VCRGDPDKGSFAGESRWRSAAQPLALALCRNKVVLAADVANAQPQALEPEPWDGARELPTRRWRPSVGGMARQRRARAIMLWWRWHSS
jgi:hypothetical protein